MGNMRRLLYGESRATGLNNGSTRDSTITESHHGFSFSSQMHDCSHRRRRPHVGINTACNVAPFIETCRCRRQLFRRHLKVAVRPGSSRSQLVRAYLERCMTLIDELCS